MVLYHLSEDLLISVILVTMMLARKMSVVISHEATGLGDNHIKPSPEHFAVIMSPPFQGRHIDFVLSVCHVSCVRN